MHEPMVKMHQRRESYQVTQLYKVINQDIDAHASDPLHLKNKKIQEGEQQAICHPTYPIYCLSEIVCLNILLTVRLLGPSVTTTQTS